MPFLQLISCVSQRVRANKTILLAEGKNVNGITPIYLRSAVEDVFSLDSSNLLSHEWVNTWVSHLHLCEKEAPVRKADWIFQLFLFCSSGLFSLFWFLILFLCLLWGIICWSSWVTKTPLFIKKKGISCRAVDRTRWQNINLLHISGSLFFWL